MGVIKQYIDFLGDPWNAPFSIAICAAAVRGDLPAGGPADDLAIAL
jgi:hypothetical protein